MKKTIIYLYFIFNLLNGQSIIGSGLTKQSLFNFLKFNYTTSSTLGYGDARDIMYSIIDLQDNNLLKGIYTNYSITLNLNEDPSTNAYEQHINCEHSWPQSMGAGSEPQKSDMHHLYPCKDNVNSSRGNKPYGEIDDQNTDKWFRLDTDQTNIPNTNIDEYSEVDFDGNLFEPRESVKGNISRGMFYFYTIYENDADQNFFDQQKEDLYLWHRIDPADQNELSRTFAIANYQNNIPNPFVVDSTLIRRIWFFNCYETVTSGQLIEFINNSINYNQTLDVNSDNKINIFDLNHIIDRENGNSSYFTCEY